MENISHYKAVVNAQGACSVLAVYEDGSRKRIYGGLTRQAAVQVVASCNARLRELDQMDARGEGMSVHYGKERLMVD